MQSLALEMAQNQDTTKESRLEEWSLGELKKEWEVVKTRIYSSQSIQQRVKHLQVETGKKFYLHRKGNIQKKENHQHRCCSWNCICEWLPPESGGRTRRLIRKLQEVLKGVESFPDPIFYILDIELMGLKLETKQTKNPTHKNKTKNTIYCYARIENLQIWKDSHPKTKQHIIKISTSAHISPQVKKFTSRFICICRGCRVTLSVLGPISKIQ